MSHKLKQKRLEYIVTMLSDYVGQLVSYQVNIKDNNGYVIRSYSKTTGKLCVNCFGEFFINPKNTGVSCLDYINIIIAVSNLPEVIINNNPINDRVKLIIRQSVKAY